jgi:hypothetical protein
VNAELTQMYWTLDQRSRNLLRMLKFAESFPDEAIVSILLAKFPGVYRSSDRSDIGIADLEYANIQNTRGRP